MERELKWVRDIVRRGSRKAADQLVREYYDDIYAFVFRQIGNREDALDVTQECFLAALRSLPFYNPQKAGLRTWLYHIASHKVIDQRRKRKIQYLPIEQLRQVEELVCAMDPQIQEVFRLRVYAEYSFPEIAAVLAQPESKIKAQYYRLSARLRKEMSEKS